MRGQISLEPVVLLAATAAIAVAVGWYIYTTWASLVRPVPNLAILSATYYQNGTLVLTALNPGTAPVVQISSIALEGERCSHVDVNGTGGGALPMAKGAVVVRAQCPVRAPPGTTLRGQVELSVGTTYPFTAEVASS